MAADRPEELVGAVEQTVFGGGEQSLVDQLARAPDVVDVLADPEERVEIAKPALALLDVGLDDVAGVAHPAVAGVALDQLVGDEGTLGAATDLRLEAALRGDPHRLAARDQPRLEHRGADRHVAARLLHHLVERPHRVADLQPHVPERVEHRLDDALRERRRGRGGEEGEVDVGVRRHLGATVAADGDERDRLGLGIEALGAVEEQPEQLVDQIRLRPRRLEPARGMLGEAARDLGAAGVERVAQERRDLGGDRIGKRGDAIGERAPVDDRAAVGKVVEAASHAG